MKYYLFLFTVLASVGFFNYKEMFSEQLLKLVFYVSVLGSLFVALREGRSLRDVDFPKVPYFVLLGSIAFSCIMGSVFHPQGLMVTIITTLPFIFAYGYVWALLKFDLPQQKIMNTYLVLCGISALVYFCNVATMPFNIFGKAILSQDLTRGIIRIPVVFIEFFPMVVFYAINKWLLSKEKKWLVVIALGALMISLSVIRQLIALTAVLGFWFFFRKISLGKKLMLVGFALVVVVAVLPQIPIYKTMMELSEDQSIENDSEEDIRIQSWRYYTYQNQESAATAIFGNGVPSAGNSVWGLMFDSEAEVSGLFPYDVGWAGFYWFFGIFATVALLVLLIKALLKPKPESSQFLNYWLVFVIVTSVASAPILYYWQILDVAVCLAMVYGSSDSLSLNVPDIKNDDEDCSDNSELQQFPRYPQLH